MRALLPWIVVGAAAASAATLDIPKVPKTAMVELQSCDLDVRQPGQSRHSTFEGQRTTWSADDVTYVLVKGTRVAEDGESIHIETKLRRREVAEGELVHETSDWVNVVTSGAGASSTDLVRQDNLVRVTGERRELVKRVTNGVTEETRETVVTTTDGPGRRTVDTKVSSEGAREMRWLCTYTTPSS